VTGWRGLDHFAAVADRRDPQGAHFLTVGAPAPSGGRRGCAQPAGPVLLDSPRKSAVATCCSTSSSATTSPATSRAAYYIMTDISVRLRRRCRVRAALVKNVGVAAVQQLLQERRAGRTKPLLLPSGTKR
jgi:hypothetical protein